MGKIITLSGPRGVGKTSVMEDMSTNHQISPIVPYTTRDPRPTEVEGKDYHFVTDLEFDTIRRTKGMFDVLTLRDRKYGTPLEEFDRAIAGPDDSVEGIRTINLAAASALELKKELGETAVKSVFLLPASWEDINQQLRDKGIPEDQILERRVAEPTDLTMLPKFNQIIINSYGYREATCRVVARFVAAATGVEIPGLEPATT